MTQAKNIDQKDVDHFSSYAEDWWNVDSTWAVLHDYNQVRVPFVMKSLKKREMLINGTLKGLKILDVGCGAGIFSEALAKKGGTVVGLDASDELIKAANEHWNTSGNKSNYDLTYVCELVEDHAEKYLGYYDVIVASEIIEHIVDKKSFLDGCLKVLRPGGSIFITTPGRGWLSFIFVKLFSEYIFRILPMGTHVYDQLISAEDLHEMVNESGCEVARQTGFFYWFIFRKFYFVTSKVLQHGMHAIKNC